MSRDLNRLRQRAAAKRDVIEQERLNALLTRHETLNTDIVDELDRLLEKLLPEDASGSPVLDATDWVGAENLLRTLRDFRTAPRSREPRAARSESRDDTSDDKEGSMPEAATPSRSADSTSPSGKVAIVTPAPAAPVVTTPMVEEESTPESEETAPTPKVVEIPTGKGTWSKLRAWSRNKRWIV